MFTDQQLKYFKDIAIQRTYVTLSKLSGVCQQLLEGDAMGNQLPLEAKKTLEVQANAKFTKLAEAFAGLSQAIAALRIGDSSLIDQIIPPVVEMPPLEPPA